MTRNDPCICGQTKTLVDYVRVKDPEAKVFPSSGYGIDKVANAVLAKGCDGFFEKPFSLEQLSRKMHAILDPKDMALHG